jgi:hypothetical protein
MAKYNWPRELEHGSKTEGILEMLTPVYEKLEADRTTAIMNIPFAAILIFL